MHKQKFKIKLLPKRLYVAKKDALGIGTFVLAFSKRRSKTDICYECCDKAIQEKENKY